MAKHNELGKLGEKIAAEFLEKKGFVIVERNYSKKWGELDIIARKSIPRALTQMAYLNTVHLVEVKSTSRKLPTDSKNLSRENKKIDKKGIPYETKDEFRPEEMIHSRKRARLKRAIQTYILERKVKDWQFDVVIVYIDENKHIARCKYLEDIIL